MVDEEGLDCERSDLVSAAVVEVGEVEGMVEIRIVSAVGYRRPTRIGVVGPGQPFLRPGWGEDRDAGADRAGVGDVAVAELRVEARSEERRVGKEGRDRGRTEEIKGESE